MKKEQNILVVAPHMDDEVYGVGGTISKFVNNGYKVYVVVLTESCSAQYPKNAKKMTITKKNETKKVSKILGIEKYFFYNFPDGELTSRYHLQCNLAIEHTIETVNPQIIFTTSFFDVHKDHRSAFESTLVAARPIIGKSPITIYTYEIPSSTEWGSPFGRNFSPSTYVDITDYIQKKIDATKSYQSEIRDYPHSRSENGVIYYARFRGLSIGVKFAEAFSLIREVK